MAQEYVDSFNLHPLRIALLGPPGAGKTTLARRLAQRYRLPLVNAKDALDEAVGDEENKLGIKAKGEMASAKDKRVSEATMGLVLRAKLLQPPCQNQGFVLGGFPRTWTEARAAFRALQGTHSAPLSSHLTPPWRAQTRARVVRRARRKRRRARRAATTGRRWRWRRRRRARFRPATPASSPPASWSCMRRRAPCWTASLPCPGRRPATTTARTVSGLPPRSARLRGLTRAPGFKRRFKQYSERNRADMEKTAVAWLEQAARLEHLPIEAREGRSAGEVEEAAVEYVERKGRPYNFHPTPSEVEAERAEREAQEKEAKEAEEEEEKAADSAEAEGRQGREEALFDRLAAVRDEEDALLEERTKPLRQYLMSSVVPTLTQGLLEVCRTKPDDPVDYLVRGGTRPSHPTLAGGPTPYPCPYPQAEWLFTHNPVETGEPDDDEF